jgi:hypothetical protein
MFIMLAGQRLRCVNPACQAEIEVRKDSIKGASNPKCCCGAEMKRPYSKPLPRNLDSQKVKAIFRAKVGEETKLPLATETVVGRM